MATVGERRDDWHLGRWGGVRLSVHWSLAVAWPALFLYFREPGAAVLACATLLLLQAAHVAGHAVLLRVRRVQIDQVRLAGLHGEVLHGRAAPRSIAFAAWGGVLAQALLMSAALGVALALQRSGWQASTSAWAPVLFVLTWVNAGLIVLALLPFGGFDGRDAWRLLDPRRWRRARARPTAPADTIDLPPPEHRELQARANREAADLLARVARGAARSAKLRAKPPTGEER